MRMGNMSSFKGMSMKLGNSKHYTQKALALLLVL